ncbi:MAG: hypothetical protein J2P53_00385 [Bradyrhizobiaceae bacterium]|nr:hypothetical protein [Bradyrhizobiaceae bacterium]
MAPRKKKLPFGFEEGEQYVTIVLKHRLRDKSASSLGKQARAVNYVWNYCNDAQKHTFETTWAWKDKWLSCGDLERLTAGASTELGLQRTTYADAVFGLAISTPGPPASVRR